MSLLHFIAVGEPAPKGSTRAFVRAGRAIVTATNKRTKPWEATVAHAAIEAGARQVEGPVSVLLDFYFTRPVGHFGKRGLRASAPAYPAVKPDLDKLTRAVLDALTGVCWRDDSRVVSIRATKRYAIPDEFAGVAVTVLEAA